MMKLLHVACALAVVAAKVDEKQAKKAVAPAPKPEVKAPAVNKLQNLESVKEYVENKEVDEIAAAHTTVALLEMETHVEQTSHSGLSANAEASMMDAVLVTDLDEDMKHVKAGEKFVGKEMKADALAHDAKASMAKQAPEGVPADLPEHLRTVFMEMAAKYEQGFQQQFSAGPPHPASYLEVNEGATQEATKHHEYQYSHMVVSEPQILLPVPASLLYRVAISEFERKNLMQSALQAHFKPKAQEKATKGIVLMETSSKAAPAAPAAGAGAGVLGESDFIDPYAFVTPASIALGAGNADSSYLTPSSVANGIMNGQQAGSMGSMGINLMPQSNNGAFGGQAGPNPAMPTAFQTAGVQSPPPPLRPDNLPPPPYIRPQPQPLALPVAGAAGAPAAF